MPERDYYTAYPRPILWLVPGGEATVGGPEPGASPRFTATVEPFYLSKLPVTNEQFEAFDPGFERAATSPGDRDPALGVSWHDAAEYCAWYAEVARKPIRLPTEVEWEYACRAGARGPCPAAQDDVGRVAWHRGNAAGGDRVPPLDEKPTNGFGFHAMLGGVWEWTGSLFRPYAPDGAAAGTASGDPEAPRVLRGGSFRTPREQLSCSRRRAGAPAASFDDAGFRIARSFRALATAFLALWATAAAAAAPDPPSGALKLYLDRPGVYSVGVDELREAAGLAALPPAGELRLARRNTGDSGDAAVPFHIEGDGPGAAARLVFVAERALFRPRDLRDARPLRALWLTWGEGRPGGVEGAAEGRAVVPAPPDAPPVGGLPEAEARRELRFEENVLRAAVTTGEEDDIETLWYWTTLSQLGSSRLAVDLGPLADRSGDGSLGLDVAVDLLGWSRTTTPDGVPTHQVDLFLNGVKIGESSWHGRRAAYDEQAARLAAPERRSVFQIFLRRAPDARDRIEALRDRVLAGDSFQRLATEYSESETRHRKGLVGWMIPGRLPAGFDEVVFGLEEGVPSEPVETRQGLHLFYVDQVLPAHQLAYEEARPTLLERLRSARQEAALSAFDAETEPPAGSMVLDRDAFTEAVRTGDGDVPVLRLGDESWTLDDLRKRVGAFVAREAAKGAAPTQELAWRLLDQARRREEIYQHCRTEGEIPRNALDARLDAWLRRNLIDAERHRRLLALAGEDEERLKTFYQSNIGDFSSQPTWTVSLLKLPLRSRPMAVMTRLERAASDAGTGLDDLQRELGGEVESLPPMTLAEIGQREPKLPRLVAPLEPDRLSAPYRSGDALEIAQVVARHEAEPLPFEEVRERVAARYVAQYTADLYDRLSERILAGIGLEIDPQALAALRAAGLPQPDVSVDQLEDLFDRM